MGQWIRSLGQLDPAVAFGTGKPLPPRVLPQDPEIAALAVHLTQSKGDREPEKTQTLRTMTAIKHAAELSVTPVREGEAPLELNTHSPNWLSQTED